MTNNQNIRSFLFYYCALNNPPEYATLIKGYWGIGKTWFIDKFLKDLQQSGQEHLYISLYGITSYDEIEDEFLRQLHPILHSKGARLFGKLTKGVLKGTFRFDFDGDGKDDGSLSAGVPTERLIESLKKAANKVLVFDDVERCSIPISDLFGFINQFVEHDGYKVILVANEDEIIKKESRESSESQAYRRIKEKLVGRTFEITPELGAALDHFINQLESQDTVRVVRQNKDLVQQLYNESGYKNLRILKNALADFDRVVSKLQEKIVNNRDLISHFLAFFLIYSFEIRSGSILPIDIGKWGSMSGLFLSEKKEKQDDSDNYQQLMQKYKGLPWYGSLLSNSMWEMVFNSGFVPSSELEEALFNSKYFQSSTQPNWVRLWHFFTLTDTEFEEALKSVIKDWQAKSYTEIGVVKHVAGLLFSLSEKKLHPETTRNILRASKAYVDHLKTHGLLFKSGKRPSIHDSFYENSGWAGLQFHSHDAPAFKELTSYVKKQEHDAILESYVIEASGLLQMMTEDPDKFLRTLTQCNHEDSQRYDIPILRHIDPADFVDAFLKLDPNARRSVSYVFEQRYTSDTYNSKLLSELNWLKSVSTLLRRAKLQYKGKLSAYQIGSLVDGPLASAIENLNSTQSKDQQTAKK